MSLRRRLGKLEHARQGEVDAWRQSWEHFISLLHKYIPEDVNDRVAEISPVDESLDDMLEERAAALGIEDLDAWLFRWELPDWDKPDLALRPEGIPMPPPEPAGVWVILQDEFRRGGLEGDVAAALLYALGAARAVREDRR